MYINFFLTRGAGKQGIAAGINLVSFYFVGIPAAFLSILYFKFGLIGAWIGLFLGEGGIMIGYIILICTLNWKKAADEAMDAATKDRMSASTPLLKGINNDEEQESAPEVKVYNSFSINRQKDEKEKEYQSDK